MLSTSEKLGAAKRKKIPRVGGSLNYISQHSINDVQERYRAH
jgi:uncharacterized protein (UPF0261 family)